jgi:hypothetical protein
MIELIIKKKYNNTYLNDDVNNDVNNNVNNDVNNDVNNIYKEYEYEDIINFSKLFLKYKNIILLIILLFFIFIKNT